MRRLAIARHLHRQSADQAGQGDLLSGLALLPLHDATEILLQTAAEQKKSNCPESLNFSNTGELLKQRAFLSLSKPRWIGSTEPGSRYRGTLPAQHDIAGFRASVTEFLIKVAADLFQVEFDSISMSLLIRSDAVRPELRAAEESLRTDDAKRALQHAALALSADFNASYLPQRRPS
jgi:hypothetical protein